VARRLLFRWLVTPDELRARLSVFAANVDAFAAPLLANPVTRNSADQLMRASAAAAANHRAAGRARSHAEFTAKLGTALEEADEAMAWTEHLVTCKRVSPESAAAILAAARQLVKTLSVSCRTARANERSVDLDKRRGKTRS
jgi:four helix bundle protein